MANRFFSAADVEKISTRSGFLYLYPLTAPDLDLYLPPDLLERQKIGAGDEDYLWIADLRLQVPMDKYILVGREPISGFASAEERLYFGDDLALRRSRPAIPSVVADSVVPLLQARSGIRYRVLVNDPVLPSTVDLLVLHDNPLTAETVGDSLKVELDRTSTTTGVAISVVKCTSMDLLSAHEYVSSVPVDLE